MNASVSFRFATTACNPPPLCLHPLTWSQLDEIEVSAQFLDKLVLMLSD